MFSSFWIGFIVGGIVCVSIVEFIQFVVMSAIGVRGLEKELKRKNDIAERRNNIRERKEPTL